MYTYIYACIHTCIGWGRIPWGTVFCSRSPLYTREYGEMLLNKRTGLDRSMSMPVFNSWLSPHASRSSSAFQFISLKTIFFNYGEFFVLFFGVLFITYNSHHKS